MPHTPLDDPWDAEGAVSERSDEVYRGIFEGNRAVMLLVDPITDEIVDANPAAADYYGYPRDRLVRMRLEDLRADAGEVVLAELRRANEEARPFWSLRHRLASAKIRHVEVYPGDVAIGGRAFAYEIVHDVTERHLAEEATRGAETRYRTLVEQLPVATYFHRFDRADPSKVVSLYIGPQIQGMFGVTPQEWVADPGIWARMVHPDDLDRVNAGGIAGRSAGTPIDTTYRMIRQDGAVVWIRDSSVPVLDEDGRVFAWQGIYQDITEQHLAEEALRAAELRYRTLVEQLPAITFIDRVDPDRPERAIPEYISPQVEEVLGYTPEEFLASGDEWAGALHPDDREETVRRGQEAQRAGEPFVAEYRMVGKDGRVVWIDERSVLLRDGSGRPELWQGIMQDVTANKRADRELRANERRFRAMFDGAAIGIARLSLDGTALEVNDAMAELLGTNRKDLVGTHIGTFLAETKDEEMPEEYQRLAAGGLDRYEADRPYIRRSGEGLWCHATVSLVRDDEGRPGFAIVMLEDITARKAAEDELALRAMHDALTGLPNRDLLMDRMAVALARLERGGSGVAVMFLDLDRFKLVNDEFGHEAGDRVLAEVARRFAKSVRPADTVSRYGGDEFVVLCQDLWSITDAIAAAERLCRCLDDPVTLPDGVTAKVGVSLGVTLAIDGARDGPRLIRDADTAMYRAKQGGAGGVAIAGDETVVVLERPL